MRRSDLRGQFGIAIHRPGQHGQGAQDDHRDFLRVLLHEVDNELVARMQMVQLGAGKSETAESVGPVELAAVDFVVARQRPTNARPARRIKLLHDDMYVARRLLRGDVTRRRRQPVHLELRVLQRQCQRECAVDPGIRDQDDFSCHDKGPLPGTFLFTQSLYQSCSRFGAYHLPHRSWGTRQLGQFLQYTPGAAAGYGLACDLGSLHGRLGTSRRDEGGTGIG